MLRFVNFLLTELKQFQLKAVVLNAGFSLVVESRYLIFRDILFTGKLKMHSNTERLFMCNRSALNNMLLPFNPQVGT